MVADSKFKRALDTLRNPDRALTVFFGLVTVVALLYAGWVYHRQKEAAVPKLAWEIVSQTPIFQVDQQVPGLKVQFGERDLLNEGMQVTTLAIRLTNNGEADLREGDFDHGQPLSINIKGGALINYPVISVAEPAELKATAMDFTQSILVNDLKTLKRDLPDSTSTVAVALDNLQDKVPFPPFIFNHGDSLTVSMVILHKRGVTPAASVGGRIGGITSIDRFIPEPKTDSNQPVLYWVLIGILVVLTMLMIYRIRRFDKQRKMISHVSDAMMSFADSMKEMMDKAIKDGDFHLMFIKALKKRQDKLRDVVGAALVNYKDDAGGSSRPSLERLVTDSVELAAAMKAKDTLLDDYSTEEIESVANELLTKSPRAE